MSEQYSLPLETRSILGKKVNRLRRAGILPATVYGKSQSPLSVQVDARKFSDVYRKSGRSALVNLEIAGHEPIAAFVHTLQRHPVSRVVLHVDFLAVDLKVEVTVSVPVHLVGESPLVASNEAILNQQLQSLDVRALPAVIPQSITVDISGLTSIDKSIHIRDITFPEGVQCVMNHDDLVVGLSQSRTATQEEESTDAAETAAEPELVRDEDDGAEEAN
ncbi:MAG TPA: 50S ribosomal protein L25 [Roseiflexaceae bacterium]|nr:50S ribosomal protein L25 [Roseiflexaceae bacterium]HMP41355.1 50S ribosomal protein L25 [Roseiflexaceae bacterium]